MKFNLDFVTPEMTQALTRSGSLNYEVALAAQREIAKAFDLPLRKGVLKGNILSNIFSRINFLPGQSVDFPVDFLSPGSESDYVAYTIPNSGRIPERKVEGDYVTVRTYDIAASLDTNLKWLRDARWDVMARMLQVLEAMFILKNNQDGFHTILAAAVGRGIKVVDSKATTGLFTKRLVAQMETTMTRQAGGNTSSLNRGQLTDMCISTEAQASILSWDLTQVPEAVRNSIYQNWETGGVSKIGRVSFHDLVELGVDQEFEVYVEDILGASLPNDKQEFVVGLDLQNRDSFVNPVKQDIELFEDPTMHRARKVGLYGTAEGGWGVLDSRRTLLGAL